MTNNLRFKAVPVDKGFIQRQRIDFIENFSHVNKYANIGVMIALVAHYNMELEKMNV